MMMVDTDERWAYKGSFTAPPCATMVYWNVLREVYPIKQKHLDQFKEQLKRSNLEGIGNYRLTQKLDLHFPFLIKEKEDNSTCTLENSNSANHEDEQSANSWDYALNGADWPNKFPSCGTAQQSPINLIDVYSKYGQAYDIFLFDTDSLVASYAFYSQASLLNDASKNAVVLSISKN